MSTYSVIVGIVTRFPTKPGNIPPQNESYGLGHLSIWKKGNAIPFFLPLFPSVGCSCREEVELVPVRMMLPFTDLDEPADTASRKTSRESFTLLGSRGSNKLLPV